MTGCSLSPVAIAVRRPTVWAPVEESLRTDARWTPRGNQLVLRASALLTSSLLLGESFQVGDSEG